MKPEVREFLDSLEVEDIVKIKAALKTYDTVESLRRVFRYVALTLLAIAVSITQFGDSLAKIRTWFH